MTDVLLFHHAQGLTPGVLAFADRLREAGHTVTTPDLYKGVTFADLQEGVDHAERVGFDEIVARGEAAAPPPGSPVVYAGFSLGVMPAQKLAQTRTGALGALLMNGCVPVDTYAPDWPDGVPVQLHVMEDDDWGDVPVARNLAAAVPGAELFLYSGDRHLFVDSSLPSCDPAAAALVVERVVAFLGSLA